MRNRIGLQLSIITYCLILLIIITSACGSDQPETTIPNIPQEGTLTLFGSTPPTLDPALARSADSMQYLVEVFSGLITFDQNLRLVPDIAERWEKTNGGKIYIFHLREGVKFHNGREVTAHDFKYSWERVCANITQSQTAETYLGDIVGVKEKLDGKAEEIAGVRVINDYTLQVTIDAPKEYFLSKLAYPTAYVVDQQNVESGDNWWKDPNGTGPFRLSEWNSSTIILERNDLYYLDTANIERVVFYLYGGVPMIMYETDEIDITGVSLGDIERVLDPTNPLNDELVITADFSLSYIGFNASKPPFDDSKVRQAFCHAIDKDKIIDLALKGVVRKADGILPPGMPGHNEYLRGLEFDVDKANQLITESTYRDVSNLPPITLTSSGTYAVSNMEAALIDMWRRNLGVDVEVKLWPPAEYAYILMGEKDEMFSIGWSADYPDPQDFLDILFRSGEENNFCEYSNEQVDQWLDEAAIEENFIERMTKYNLAEQEIVNDAACLPLFFNVSYTLVKPYVKDLPATPLWIPRFRYVYIEPH